MEQRPSRRLLVALAIGLPALAAAQDPAGARNAAADREAGKTELHRAARSGDLQSLRAQLEAGQDVNARDAAGRTPLFDAAAAGRLDAVTLLLEAHADVKARTPGGRSVLMEAAEHGQAEVATALIEAGAELDVAQRGWGTALEVAERMGHENVAALLLRAGARSSGRSVGDTVCVRPWAGDGYCGVVEASRKTSVRIRISELVGCADGCPAQAECSAGQPVGGANGLRIGDVVTTVSWCLTHTGVRP
jgi:ankyrin repeat protein